MMPCWWRRRWPWSLSPSPSMSSTFKAVLVCPCMSKTVPPITCNHDSHIKSEFRKTRSERIYKCHLHISTYSLRIVILCPASYADSHISSEFRKIKSDHIYICHRHISTYSLRIAIPCPASYAEVISIHSFCMLFSEYIPCACP